jgi:hypothetical protein
MDEVIKRMERIRHWLQGLPAGEPLVLTNIQESDLWGLLLVGSFIEAILKRTPRGEYIAVQYHPNGDWTVATEPLDRIKDQSHGG